MIPEIRTFGTEALFGASPYISQDIFAKVKINKSLLDFLFGYIVKYCSITNSNKQLKKLTIFPNKNLKNFYRFFYAKIITRNDAKNVSAPITRVIGIFNSIKFSNLVHFLIYSPLLMDPF